MNELGTIARSLLKDGFTYSQVKEVLEHALRLKGLTDEQIERHLQFLSEQPCVLTSAPAARTMPRSQPKEAKAMNDDIDQRRTGKPPSGEVEQPCILYAPTTPEPGGEARWRRPSSNGRRRSWRWRSSAPSPSPCGVWPPRPIRSPTRRSGGRRGESTRRRGVVRARSLRRPSRSRAAIRRPIEVGRAKPRASR